MSFQYLYRGDDFRDLSRETRDLLDQRDQSLENYLNTPYLKVRRVANQTIASGAQANISFDTEDSDEWGFISVTSDTITVPAIVPGLYAIGAWAETTGGALGNIVFLNLNGSTLQGAAWSAASSPYKGFVSANAYLVANDTIKLEVQNNALSSRNYTATLWMTRVLA